MISVLKKGITMNVEKILLENGCKKWEKNDHCRIYIKAEQFNALFETKFGDSNNRFYYDCNTQKMMRSYKNKSFKIYE